MSLSSRTPAKAMRVPGIRCIGFLMYSAKVAVAPCDAGGLVGIGVVEAREGAGGAAVETVERRTELDLRAGTGVVTGKAHPLEHALAGFRVLRQARSGGRDHNAAANRHFLITVSF